MDLLKRQNRVTLIKRQHVRPRLRSLLAYAAVALSALGTGACGAGHKDSPSAWITVHGLHDNDGDVDKLTPSPQDIDNDAIPHFGQTANAAERSAIAALIGRYYTAAAVGEGAKACSMLDPRIAEALVEEHHSGKGPPALQGDTCAQVMSKLFRSRHRELAEDISGYRALVVQVRGNNGYALVRFPAKRELRELQVLVHREQGERGAWKMAVAFDNGAQ
jgi:hypothetical protein